MRCVAPFENFWTLEHRVGQKPKETYEEMKEYGKEMAVRVMKVRKKVERKGIWVVKQKLICACCRCQGAFCNADK